MQNARAAIPDCYSIPVSSAAGGSTPGSECRTWDFIAMHLLGCNFYNAILCISCNVLVVCIF